MGVSDVGETCFWASEGPPSLLFVSNMAVGSGSTPVRSEGQCGLLRWAFPKCPSLKGLVSSIVLMGGGGGIFKRRGIVGGLRLSRHAFEGDCGALVLFFPSILNADVSNSNLSQTCTMMCLFTTNGPTSHTPSSRVQKPCPNREQWILPPYKLVVWVFYYIDRRLTNSREGYGRWLFNFIFLINLGLMYIWPKSHSLVFLPLRAGLDCKPDRL